MPLQIRRGTNAERLAMTQPLAAGELLFTTNEQKLYVGDGNVLGGIQITGYTDNDAKDSAAAIFTEGSHNGLTFAYNTANNTMAASVNLSNYNGVIRADAFKGSVFADDGSTIGGTILVDAVDGVLRGQHIGTLTGNVTGNVTGNLIGNVTGNITGNLNGVVTGDLIGSVLGENSTVLLDATDNTLRANVISQNIQTEDLNCQNIVIDLNLDFGGIRIDTQGNTTIDPYDLFNITTANASSVPNFASFNKARGTIASPAALDTNDGIFSILFAGHSNVDYEVAATIEAAVDGSVGTYTPGKLIFQTSDSLGNLLPRLTIDSNGTSIFSGMTQIATFTDVNAANAAIGGVGNLANGMMYYDATLSKIRAVAGGVWVDLN